MTSPISKQAEDMRRLDPRLGSAMAIADAYRDGFTALIEEILRGTPHDQLVAIAYGHIATIARVLEFVKETP